MVNGDFFSFFYLIRMNFFFGFPFRLLCFFVVENYDHNIVIVSGAVVLDHQQLSNFKPRR